MELREDHRRREPRRLRSRGGRRSPRISGQTQATNPGAESVGRGQTGSDRCSAKAGGGRTVSHGSRRPQEEAKEAERRLAEIERAIEYHEKDAERRGIDSKLKRFPDGIEELHRDDRQRLDDLSAQRTESENQNTKETKLSSDDVERVTVEELRSNHSDLSDCEADIRNQENSLREAQSAVDAAAEELGERLNDLPQDLMHRVPISKLYGFLEEVERIRARAPACVRRSTTCRSATAGLGRLSMRETTRDVGSPMTLARGSRESERTDKQFGID